MKNKEYYDLTKIDCIVDHKINGCGKIIPNRWIVQIVHEGKRLGGRVETEKNVYRFMLDWAEKEKE